MYRKVLQVSNFDDNSIWEVLKFSSKWYLWIIQQIEFTMMRRWNIDVESTARILEIQWAIHCVCGELEK